MNLTAKEGRQLLHLLNKANNVDLEVAYKMIRTLIKKKYGESWS